MENSINEIRANKTAFEEDLANIISSKLTEFEINNGLTPEAININLVDVSVLGDKYPKYKLGNVEIILKF
ncbi:MAG: hypothetical protein V4605_04750 [Pseudomonadota bacterium]